MAIAELCRRNVITIDRRESLREAARQLRAQHVGSLVVVDRETDPLIPLGVLTDRDIVVAVDAAGVDLEAVMVGEAITDPVVTAPADATLWQALARMRTHQVRRLPVVDEDGRLHGMLSIDDVLGVLADTLADMAWLTAAERDRERVIRP
jgi:CBS domain-containing protein